MTEELLAEIYKQFQSWLELTKCYRVGNGNLYKSEYDQHHNIAFFEYLKLGNGLKFIKSFEAYCEVTERFNQPPYNLNTSNPPCYPEDFAAIVINSTEHHFGDKRPEIPEDIPEARLAAAQFSLWFTLTVDTQLQFGQTSKYLSNPTKAFNDYLVAGCGFKYIKNYDEFCQVAELLKQEYSFQISTPPCNSIEFADMVLKATPEHYSKVKPTLDDQTKVDLMAQRFSHWMENDIKINHPNSKFSNYHNIALINFIISYDPDFLITTYENFCSLAVNLKENYNYNIQMPPCNESKFKLMLSNPNVMMSTNTEFTTPIQNLPNNSKKRPRGEDYTSDLPSEPAANSPFSSEQYNTESLTPLTPQEPEQLFSLGSPFSLSDLPSFDFLFSPTQFTPAGEFDSNFLFDNKSDEPPSASSNEQPNSKRLTSATQQQPEQLFSPENPFSSSSLLPFNSLSPTQFTTPPGEFNSSLFLFSTDSEFSFDDFTPIPSSND